MDKFANFLLSFIEWNEGINYNKVFILVMIYFGAFWFAISFWVMRDATSRGVNKWLAIFIGLGNFFLFIPFLIVYLLARPHFTDDLEDWQDGGVNVPIVNFTGKDGIEMTFELRIHPKKMATNNASEMKIDIQFDSNDSQKQIVTNSQDNKSGQPIKLKTGEQLGVSRSEKGINSKKESVTTFIKTLKGNFVANVSDIMKVRKQKAEARKIEKAKKAAEAKIIADAKKEEERKKAEAKKEEERKNAEMKKAEEQKKEEAKKEEQANMENEVEEKDKDVKPEQDTEEENDEKEEGNEPQNENEDEVEKFLSENDVTDSAEENTKKTEGHDKDNSKE